MFVVRCWWLVVAGCLLLIVCCLLCILGGSFFVHCWLLFVVCSCCCCVVAFVVVVIAYGCSIAVVVDDAGLGIFIEAFFSSSPDGFCYWGFVTGAAAGTVTLAVVVDWW